MNNIRYNHHNIYDDKVYIKRKIDQWRMNPVLFVKENFKVTPDPWQADFLIRLVDPKINKLALVAAVGVGKTATLAWAGWYELSLFATQTHCPKGIAISITENNLKTGLWSELTNWRLQSKFLTDQFLCTKSRISHKHPSLANVWGIDAKAFAQTADAETAGEALSGIHSDNVFFLIDETGEMPYQIALRAYQAIGGTKRVKILQAGNPTGTSGMLYKTTELEKGKPWYTVNITADPNDPMRSSRISKEVVQRYIDEYGRDNAYVMGRYLGQFPETSIDTLLSHSEVKLANDRYVAWNQDQEDLNNDFHGILGVDLAFGGHDRTILWGRKNNLCYKPKELREEHLRNIVPHIIEYYNKFPFKQVFVDAAGKGDELVDLLGRNYSHLFTSIPIHFGGKAIKNKLFKNKRSEMLEGLRNAVKHKLAIPYVSDFTSEVTVIKREEKDGVINMLPKEMVRKEIQGKSPDYSDALALTFAYPNTEIKKNPFEDHLTHPKAITKQQSSSRCNHNPFGYLTSGNRINTYRRV